MMVLIYLYATIYIIACSLNAESNVQSELLIYADNSILFDSGEKGLKGGEVESRGKVYVGHSRRC